MSYNTSFFPMQNDTVLELAVEYGLAFHLIPEFAEIRDEALDVTKAPCLDCAKLSRAAVPMWVMVCFEVRGRLEGWQAITKFKRFMLVMSKLTSVTAALDTIARASRHRGWEEAERLWIEFKAKAAPRTKQILKHQETRKRREDGRAPRVSDKLYAREWDKARATSQGRKQREETGKWPKRTARERRPKSS